MNPAPKSPSSSSSNRRAYSDFRDFLSTLESRGLLRRVSAPVDKDWEISSVMRWVFMGNREEDRYAVVFENIKGFQSPVVVGALGASYQTYALAMGIDPTGPREDVIKGIRSGWQEAFGNCREPVLVESGPCKENILKGKDIDLHRFPVPVWVPRKDRNWDQGLGYITAPYHVTRDPETRIRNVGTYRSMVRSEPYMMGVAPNSGSHMHLHIIKNEAAGKPTEVATVIGADPALGLVSMTNVPYGLDEYALAGGIRGAPIELVKCETVDLEVPANAEIVIEGKIYPRSQRPWEVEGPFGEYPGYQGTARLSPVIEISCISYRNRPIFQGFLSQMPPSESSKLRHLGREAFLLATLHQLGIEDIVDIHMPESAQSTVTIVAIKKRYEGHPMRVANAIFAALQPRNGKFVIVTDDDVDVRDYDNLLWAMGFRVRLTPQERHIHFIEALSCPGLDYSAAPSLEESRKRWNWPAVGVVIDATRPYKPYPVTSQLPEEFLSRAWQQWEKYQLPKPANSKLPNHITTEEGYLKEGIVVVPDLSGDFR